MYRHLGLGFYVCLHPVCSLLHPGLLGFFIPQVPLQVSVVSGFGVGPVGHTDLCPGTVSNLHRCAPPAATSFTLHCDSGAGECFFKVISNMLGFPVIVALLFKTETHNTETFNIST